MKIIKLGLISIFIFGAILFLLSLLIPSTIRVSRAIDINATNISGMVADTTSWSKWNELYSDSLTVELISSAPQKIESIWSYGKNRVPVNFTITESNGVSVLQWYFEFRLRWYPWEKFGSIIFDKQFGPPMERSLNTLKKLIENSQ